MWMISRPVSGPETDLCIKTKRDKTSVGNVQRKDTERLMHDEGLCSALGFLGQIAIVS